jgi:hypothetical protein
MKSSLCTFLYRVERRAFTTGTIIEPVSVLIDIPERLEVLIRHILTADLQSTNPFIEAPGHSLLWFAWALAMVAISHASWSVDSCHERSSASRSRLTLLKRISNFGRDPLVKWLWKPTDKRLSCRCLTYGGVNFFMTQMTS